MFIECYKLGIPFQGLTHDWHKLLPSEFFPYAHFFQKKDGTQRQKRNKTGYYKPVNTGDSDFDLAWFLHQKRAWHHWQSWVYPKDKEEMIALPIPEKYRREMLADWRGAGRAQGTPDTVAWYKANGHKLRLHPETRRWIEGELGI